MPGPKVAWLVTLWLAAAAFVPVLVVMCFVRLPSIFDRIVALRDRVVPSRRRMRVRAEHRSVELLAADLRRLSVQLHHESGSREFLKVRRMQATALAYDDVLREACETLEVDPPDHRPFDDLERLETEAALAQRGLVW